MAELQKRGAWPQIRRALIISALLAGGIAVLSLLGGREGDFEAGLPGAIVGASVGAVVVVVELIGRRLTRKPPAPDGKGGVETETQKGT
jgi:hypothetical protein